MRDASFPFTYGSLAKSLEVVNIKAVESASQLLLGKIILDPAIFKVFAEFQMLALFGCGKSIAESWFEVVAHHI